MDAILVARLIVLALSGFLVGFTIMVAAQYMVRWLDLPDEKRRTWRGLLPLHVWCVAISYDLLVVSASVEVWTRLSLDARPSWRLFVLVPAYVLGVAAMVIIARRKVRGQLKNTDD